MSLFTRKRIRSSFTLLEVVISFFLVGILMAFLFSFFKQTLTTKSQTFVLKEKAHKWEILHLRLGQLFLHLNEEKNCFIATIPHPDAQGSALVFYGNQGIAPDPSFSGSIHSMLYKTRDQRLCLCSWSKLKAAHVDTLVDKVKDLSFAFFTGKQWQTRWPKEKEDAAFPVMVKITVTLQGADEKPYELIYSLPPSGKIVYEKKAI